jgi:hypothetical protein
MIFGGGIFWWWAVRGVAMGEREKRVVGEEEPIYTPPDNGGLWFFTGKCGWLVGLAAATDKFAENGPKNTGNRQNAQ